MSSNARPPAPQALPVADTVRTVLRTVRDARIGLARAAIGPFTAVFLIEGVIGIIPGVYPALELLAFAAVIVATSMFMVDAHRVFLLGETARQSVPRLQPGSRDLRYLGRALLVGLTVGLGLLLPVLVLSPGFVALPGGVYIFAFVVSLLAIAGMLAVGQKLAATAVDRDMTIAASWDAAKGRLPGILGVVTVLIAPIHLLAAVAAGVYAAASVSQLPVIPALVLSLGFQFGELTLVAALLSLLYERFSGVDLTV
jgi:hypothetical protein